MTQTIAKPANGSHNGKGLEGFKVLDELARSPKGIIYKAVRQVEHDTVAVKSFRQRLCEKKFIGNLMKNAEATFFLEHPHLVRSLGCTNENQRLLLIMDYACGEALSRKLKQKLPISVKRCLQIILQCAEALQYAAGRDRFHGRLHPGDILAGEESVRVIGVGLGERPEHPAWSSQEGHLFEPLIYTAPEAMPSQAFPEGRSSLVAVDVYALGAILFHLLTGTPPFRGTDENALLAERQALKGPVEWPAVCDLAQDLCALVERMLAPEAALRPSYEQLLATLKDLIKTADRPDSKRRSAAQGGIREAAPARVEVRAPHVPPELYMPARPGNPAEFARRRVDKEKWAPTAWTLALAVLTAVVFTFAMTITYFHAAQPTPSPAALPAPKPQSTPLAPSPADAVKKEPVAKNSLPAADDTAPLVATRQLEMLEDMLKRGEARQTPGLLRVVKQIADTLGKATPNGMRAVILAAEIEETIARNYRPLSNDAAPAPAIAPPTPLTPAPAVPVETKLAADNSTASASAKGTEAALTQAVTGAPGGEAEAHEAFAAMLKSVMSKAAVLQYDAAISELEKFAQDAQAPRKKLANDLAGLIRQEEAFVQRCRKRLLNDVERNPKKESPLTVKRKQGTIIEDIMDFDDRGLRLTNRSEQKTRVLEWEAVPKIQSYGMMQKLADPKNADDALGLCILSFTRRLVDEHEAALQSAGTLLGAKEKVPAVSEVCRGVGAMLAEKK